MRAAFIRTLVEIAKLDPRVLLLTADLGYMALEPFSELFPGRFFNVGVAEQNMVGMATGLADAGYIPFIYSIVPFAVLRPYEFIRNGPILHHLPVRIVGMGGGLDYGTNGISHYGLEDVGVLRIQPEIAIFAPADFEQAREILLASWNMPEPVYYRLSKDDKTIVPGLSGQFKIGSVNVIRQGTDIMIISMGPIAVEAVRAAEILDRNGVSASVMVIADLTSAIVPSLVEILSAFTAVLTVEEHYVTGGIGSLVSEVIAEAGIPCKLVRMGIKTLQSGITGSQKYMYQMHGLLGEQLADTAIKAIHDIPRTKNIEVSDA
jgi:transketolase